MKRDYENDAWEMLEDYFDRIRAELIKANIKGDERRQVITDLRSHIQMKADEVLEHHDIVNYADILEFIGELGSPSEIAESYGHDMDNAKAKNIEELLVEKKLSSEFVPPVNESEYDKPQTATPPEASLSSGNQKSIIIELCLLSLRIFQVIIFTQPWFQLAMFSYNISWLGVRNLYSNLYVYEGNVLNFYIPYILTVFILIMVEQYIVREILISRSYNPEIQEKSSILLFRFALLSNLVVFFILPSSFSILFYALIGTVLLLVNEAMTDSPLRTFLLKRITECYREITSNDTKYGMLILADLLLFYVGIYIVAVFYMNIIVPLIWSFTEYNLWISVLEAIMIGLFLACIALIIKLIFNSYFTYSLEKIEIVNIIWAFRFILASIFVVSWRMDLSIVLIALPLLFTEHIFTKIVTAVTKLDFTLWQEAMAAYTSVIRLFSLSGGLESNKDNLSATTQSLIPDQNTASQPISKAQLGEKDSHLMEFIKKIAFVYLKVSVAFLFIMASYSLEIIIRDYYNDYYYYIDSSSLFGTIIMLIFMLVSTYKLFTKTTTNPEKPERPWFYWMMMIFSWILLFQITIIASMINGTNFFLIWFLSLPFLLIQVSSTYSLLFKGNRKDY
ncbi:MAG: HAAS signaling domain-containing protein [Candidatus Hodarchaeales archaeon]